LQDRVLLASISGPNDTEFISFLWFSPLRGFALVCSLSAVAVFVLNAFFLCFSQELRWTWSLLQAHTNWSSERIRSGDRACAIADVQSDLRAFFVLQQQFSDLVRLARCAARVFFV
jgi:hypothetical protein